MLHGDTLQPCVQSTEEQLQQFHYQRRYFHLQTIALGICIVLEQDCQNHHEVYHLRFLRSAKCTEVKSTTVAYHWHSPASSMWRHSTNQSAISYSKLLQSIPCSLLSFCIHFYLDDSKDHRGLSTTNLYQPNWDFSQVAVRTFWKSQLRFLRLPPWHHQTSLSSLSTSCCKQFLSC